MFKLIKYWGLIMRLRDVNDIYQAEKQQGKPWYLSRRFVGSVVTLVGLGLSVHYGVSLDEKSLQAIADNILSVITAGVTLYGLIMTIVGAVGAAKRGRK
jgi:hypothetical protein